MESNENQERLKLEADRIRDEQEKEERIKSRLQDIKLEKNDLVNRCSVYRFLLKPCHQVTQESTFGIVSRRRVSGQLRSATIDEPDELPPIRKVATLVFHVFHLFNQSHS